MGCLHQTNRIRIFQGWTFVFVWYWLHVDVYVRDGRKTRIRLVTRNKFMEFVSTCCIFMDFA